MFSLHWKFRNDHDWQIDSDSLDDLFDYMKMCQLVTHPDVVYVEIKKDGEFYTKYKES